jgi:S1-C subfamily serine protease/tetratricopeptide (TPR) repeat protein
MLAQWFYQTAEGHPSGPVDPVELRRLAEVGIVKSNTLVREGDSGDWVLAQQVQGLFQQVTPPPPVPPPLPNTMRRSGAPNRDVGGANSIRKGLDAVAVNAAYNKPDPMQLATLVAVIASTGFVLLLLIALAFRGGGSTHQAENDPQPSVVAQSAEFGDTDLTTTSDGLPIANEGDSSVIESDTSPSPAYEARVIRDPRTLYENSRIAVATISTKDSQGYDSGQGSGFFINISQVDEYTPGPYFDATGGDDRFPRRGYLLTNYHVIRAAASAKVRVPDFGVQLDGDCSEVIMESEDLDLALLSVSLRPPIMPGIPFGIDSFDWAAASKIPWWRSGIPTLGIADREDPVVGTKVYAIGSPQGLEATFSEGIVSGYRSVSEGLPRLQFSAAVSPGSSGGPLLDETGQVVGVVTALHRGGQNLNFAVSASEVRDFLKGRCNSRELWRGVSIDDEADAASRSVWRAFDISEGRRRVELMTIIVVVEDAASEANKTAKQYREWLETLLRVDPSSCGDFEYLLHYARGKAGTMVAILDILETRTPPVIKSEQGLPAQKQVSIQLQRSPDHQAGIRFLKQSLQLNPKFPPALDRLSGAFLATGQYAESLLAADKLVQLVPLCSKAHDARGSALRELGQFDMSLKAYQTATKLSPANPFFYASLGEIYDKLDVNDKAIESFEMAIALGDVSDLTCLHLAFSLQKAGRFTEAIVRFQEARANYAAQGLQNIVDICDGAIAECRTRKQP